MRIDTVDVLVVGGGPAGLSVALKAAAGGKVLVVHKDAGIGRPIRTSGGSWLMHLKELGIPAHLYREVDSLVFAGPNTRQLVKFAEDRPVVINVTETFKHLAALAVAAGARIQTGTKFLRIVEESANGVCCEVQSEAGTKQITARFVVDASGHHRAVLRSAGHVERFARVGVGVEYEFENPAGYEHVCTLFVGRKFAPAGYGWIFPTTDDRVRVGIGIIRPDSAESAANMMDRFLKSPVAAELDLRAGNLVESHFGVIPSDSPAEAFSHGRILAVGDSAGQALSLIGEGIRYSIEAGRSAGEAIADALSGARCHEDAFRDYESAWKSRYGRRFDLAQRVNRRIARFQDADWDHFIPMLGAYSGDDIARILRMELGVGLNARVLLRGGVRGLRFAARYVAGRLRRRAAADTPT